MDKKVFTCDRIGESYFQIKHKSGLTILLCPKTEYNSAYALFGTKFGSVNATFKTQKDDEFVTIPDGIAHFLEHKLFEGEEEDAFISYARTGASANAYTSFDRTCYLFSTTENFNESLRVLLNFVTHPYFTKETVEKEQGIIGQEIRMYEDNPNWQVFLNLLKALYQVHPIRIDIAGSIESISKIDDKLLYRCYNTFYNLGNMVLSIAGNFVVEDVLKIADEVLKSAEELVIENKIPEEPRDILEKKIEKNLEVSMPVFEIGFKEVPDSSENLIKGQLQNEMLLELITGEATDFYRRLYDAGIINATFGSEVLAGEGYLANVFSGEVRDPQQVYDQIVSEIERIKIQGIDKQRFENVKKQAYGRYVRMFNTVENIASIMLSAHFAGTNAYQALEFVANMTAEDLEERLKTQLDPQYSAISIINPVA